MRSAVAASAALIRAGPTALRSASIWAVTTPSAPTSARDSSTFSMALAAFSRSALRWAAARAAAVPTAASKSPSSSAASSSSGASASVNGAEASRRSS
ncbi:Uncharacterised protein [Mycobacteroides abscessus subsp. abscessus]|nr:Uncharacterised protein [Mycobacteroides abscessus subsp. abscessus]